MRLASALRWIGVVGLAAVAVYAWSTRDPGLVDQAEEAALAQGSEVASFGDVITHERGKVVCGKVDGRRAFYRERGGLSVDDGTPQWSAAHRGWCEA